MIVRDLPLVLVLLGLVGAVAAVRLSVQRIGRSRLRTLREEGFQGAETLAKVQDRARLARASAHLVEDILSLTALGVGVANRTFTLGEGPFWLDLVFGGAVLVLARNLLPQVVALHYPVRVGLSGAPPLLALAKVAAPVVRLARRSSGNGGEAPRAGERELREIREIGREEGVIEEAESRLVERAFRLDELAAKDVMVPRVDMFAWPEELTTGAVHAQLEGVPFSRVPVYGESIDDVKGVVHLRDVYRQLAAGATETRLAELARRPMFVPPSRSCAELLSDFRARRVHLGIVADEFGGTDGLVTLEDVVEELVGEIHDETDIAEEAFVHTGEGQVLCGGGADLRDVAEALGITFPKGEHRSVNGLILEERGRIPERGESLVIGDVRVEVTGRTDSRVTRARLTKRRVISGRRD